jgi:hypothetical protein
MTDTIDLICYKCKHFTPLEGGCEAFPEGIPDEILRTNEHSKPLADQKNSIVFEPGENEINKN